MSIMKKLRDKAFPLTAVLICSLLLGATTALAGGDHVVAKVNGVELTQGELEESLQGELMKIERQRHQLLAQGLDAKIRDMLIEAEAEKRGISKEDLTKAEVQDKAAEVPAEEVDAFYQARQAQIRQPKEQVEEQIRSFLAYQAWIERLEAGAKIEKALEPYRLEVAATGPAKGPEDAPVTIVEFGDFECPPCGTAYSTVKKVREAYGDKVRVVFRQYPLRSIHPNAQKAGEASLCAGDQGKFWEMHDQMFENQNKLAVADLETLAASIEGLDTGAFKQCLEEGKHAETVAADLEDGQAVGVSGTPSFFVNGRPLSGVPSYETFVAVIDEELAADSAG